jgi:ferredoxin
MVYKIDSECICCGACLPECPVEAISEGPEFYVIDPKKCNECQGYFNEKQCAAVCCVDACVPDHQYNQKYRNTSETWSTKT